MKKKDVPQDAAFYGEYNELTYAIDENGKYVPTKSKGWDPKIIASTVVLLAYCAGLADHQFLGWRGRRMNLLAIGAFLCVILAMALVHHFFPSFHDFSLRAEAA